MGGGALMTPILVILFKVQPLAAVSSDLVASMVMKPVGAGVHLRRGTVNWTLVRWLAAGSIPFAFAGLFILKRLGNGTVVEDRRSRTVHPEAPPDTPDRNGRWCDRGDDLRGFGVPDHRVFASALSHAQRSATGGNRPRAGRPARGFGRQRPHTGRRLPAEPDFDGPSGKRSRRLPRSRRSPPRPDGAHVPLGRDAQRVLPAK